MGNYSQIGVTRLREAYRGLREEVGYFGGTGLMFCSFWKLRSMTYTGIAEAMADQWGQ